MLAALIARLTGRSRHWPRTRKAFLAANPKCAACGAERWLNVHHIVPFHVDPSLELQWHNLITLCEPGVGGNKCHLRIGHNNNWRDANPHVKADAWMHLRLVKQMATKQKES